MIALIPSLEVNTAAFVVKHLLEDTAAEGVPMIIMANASAAMIAQVVLLIAIALRSNTATVPRETVHAMRVTTVRRRALAIKW